MILTKQHQSLAVLIGLGLVGTYFVTRMAAGAAVNAAGTAANAVNPVNRRNIFHRGVNAVGAAIAGNDDFSLGVAIYEATHDDELEALTNGKN